MYNGNEPPYFSESLLYLLLVTLPVWNVTSAGRLIQSTYTRKAERYVLCALVGKTCGT